MKTRFAKKRIGSWCAMLAFGAMLGATAGIAPASARDWDHDGGRRGGWDHDHGRRGGWDRDDWRGRGYYRDRGYWGGGYYYAPPPPVYYAPPPPAYYAPPAYYYGQPSVNFGLSLGF